MLVIVVMVFSNQSGKNSGDSSASEAKATVENLDQPCSDNKYPVIHHKYFSLAYDPASGQAVWVGYTLSAGMTEKSADRKSCSFKADPLVANNRVEPSDYTRSGYDRGHLCPAGDMSFDIQALTETFYMSNMSPQDPSFNRGIWKKLEETIRLWALRDREIIIITGGSLKYTSGYIGKSTKIAIPRYFYKIILDYKEPDIKAIAFVLKNEASSGSLEQFVVSVDSVENMTGVDFFCNLPDDTENRIESGCKPGAWFK